MQHAYFRQAPLIPVIVEQLAQSGIDTAGSTPEEFRAHMQTETARWQRLAMIAGIAQQ